MEGFRVAIVIPAYNEAQTILAVIKEVIPFGTPIVVDDGSHDETAKIAKRAGATVVSHQSNLGYDAAINSGFIMANELNFNIVITMDADGQHQGNLLGLFIEKIENGYDLVLGIRNEFQRFGELLFAFYTKIFFGVKDPLCGLKAYRIELFQTLGCYDSYHSFGTQLALYSIKNECNFCEIPIFIKKRRDQSRFKRVLVTNILIIFAILKAIFLIKKL